jgi:hypothetical protein
VTFRQSDRVYGSPISVHPMIWDERKAVTANDANEGARYFSLNAFLRLSPLPASCVRYTRAHARDTGRKRARRAAIANGPGPNAIGGEAAAALGAPSRIGRGSEIP